MECKADPPGSHALLVSVGRTTGCGRKTRHDEVPSQLIRRKIAGGPELIRGVLEKKATWQRACLLLVWRKANQELRVAPADDEQENGTSVLQP